MDATKARRIVALLNAIGDCKPIGPRVSDEAVRVVEAELTPGNAHDAAYCALGMALQVIHGSDKTKMLADLILLMADILGRRNASGPMSRGDTLRRVAECADIEDAQLQTATNKLRGIIKDALSLTPGSTTAKPEGNN